MFRLRLFLHQRGLLLLLLVGSQSATIDTSCIHRLTAVAVVDAGVASMMGGKGPLLSLLSISVFLLL